MSQFMKAESDLCPSTTLSLPASTSSDSQTTISKTPIIWLPVGADMTVIDDFDHSAVKSKAVASTNGHLKEGQTKQAMDTLKVAEVNVIYTMAVVPMKKTLTDIGSASDLLSQGKYYQADEMLKRVIDAVRYDQVSFSAMPSQTNAQK
jgi:hypothetical protein